MGQPQAPQYRLVLRRLRNGQLSHFSFLASNVAWLTLGPVTIDSIFAAFDASVLTVPRLGEP